MKTYKVTCSVPEDKLQVLIKYYEAIGVTGFSVNLASGVIPPALPQSPPQQNSSDASAVHRARPSLPKQKSFHYVGGKRNKGISARDLTLQILNTSPDPVVTCQELRSEFVKHGFAKTSISSPLSILANEKRIVSCGEGRWVLRNRYITAANGASPEA